MAHPEAHAEHAPLEIPIAEVTDPAESAELAGLRYVNDQMRGYRRERAGEGFNYYDTKGQQITAAKELDRIKHIGIPPAWTDVWICPWKNGHIQATGRDARGRKQYRYHPQWRAVRDETKYGRMIAFGEALPLIRERVDRDMALPGMPREKALAAAVDLLDTTLIRVGNEEYAKENKSYGLTTLRNKHAKVAGSQIHLHFKGKSGKEQDVAVKDRRLARIVRRMQDLPGQDLFEYVDDNGATRAIESDDVNVYLREVTGEDFTAKDFRTWGGTVCALVALRHIGEFETVTQGKHNVVQAIQQTAERLGNTPAICKKSYVHPGVLDSYLDRSLLGYLQEHCADPAEPLEPPQHGLKPEEQATLDFLRHQAQPVAEHQE